METIPLAAQRPRSQPARRVPQANSSPRATGGTTLALAEATKDSDLTVDPRILDAEPLVEEAMGAAGFKLDPVARQPGAWINADRIPVDLMVPEALAGSGGRRSARVPPHDRNVMRRAWPGGGGRRSQPDAGGRTRRG